MDCPKCMGKSKVVGTDKKATYIGRYRVCLSCEYNFLTKEVLFFDDELKEIKEYQELLDERPSHLKRDK